MQILHIDPGSSLVFCPTEESRDSFAAVTIWLKTREGELCIFRDVPQALDCEVAPVVRALLARREETELDLTGQFFSGCQNLWDIPQAVADRLLLEQGNYVTRLTWAVPGETVCLEVAWVDAFGEKPGYHREQKVILPLWDFLQWLRGIGVGIFDREN